MLLAALNSFPGKQEKQGGDSASEDERPSSASEPQGREVPDTTQGWAGHESPQESEEQ